MNLEGSEERFLAEYERHADALFRHCYFKLSDRETALDVTQETFLRAWERVAAGDHIENMRAFLFRIAGNLIIDFYRKKKSSSLDVLIAAGFDFPEENARRLADILDGKAALKLVAKLDAKYREVIIMRYIEDLSPKEIAIILDLPENTVSVRIHRGVRALRELYDDHERHP